MISLTRAVVLLVFAVLASCGESASPRADGSSGDEAPAPTIPADPLALVGPDAEGLLVVDLAKLRSWTHADTLRRWLDRVSCESLHPEPPVLARTERVIVAAFPESAAGDHTTPDQLLLLAEGRYAAGDTSEAVATLGEVLGRSGPVIDADTRGRFVVVTDGQRMAAALGPRRIAIGAATQVERMLARLERGERGDIRQSAMFTALDAGRWLRTQAVAGLLAGAGRARGVRIGGLAKPLARELEHTPSGFGASLDDGAETLFVAQLGDASRANAFVAEVRGVFAQTDLVMRLMGLPVLSERVRDEIRDAFVRLSVRLDDAEVARIVAALDRLIEAAPRPVCPGVSGAEET